MRPDPTTHAAVTAPSARPLFRRASALALAAVAAGVAGLVGGCASEPPPPPPRNEVVAVEPGSFKVAWRVSVDTARDGEIISLHRLDDSVYAYTREKVVQAVTTGGGRTQFVTRVARPDDTVYPPVTLDADGRAGGVEQVLAFPTGWGFTLLGPDGRLIKETRLPASLTTAAAVTNDNQVLIGAADDNGGRLLKVDPLLPNGHITERVLLDGALAGRPAFQGSRAFAADLEGKAYGMTSVLRQAWTIRAFQTEMGRAVTAPVVADDYGVYIAGTDGTLNVLSRERGRILWRYFAGQPLYQEPVPVGDYVYQAVLNRGVVALPKYDGSRNSRDPAWIAEDAYAFLSHDDRNVYLVQQDGRIAAHDKKTGEKLFVSQRSDFSRFARNVDGPRIFAATRSGEFVAIDPVTGRGEVGEVAMVLP